MTAGEAAGPLLLGPLLLASVREVISRYLRLMAKAGLVAWGGSSRQVRDLPGLMRLRGGSE